MFVNEILAFALKSVMLLGSRALPCDRSDHAGTL